MPSPTPAPSAPAFRFSSRPASSSSSLAIALACSATCLAASPTPGFAVSPLRMGMAPPVDDLREDGADAERGSRDDEGIRSAFPGAPVAELRSSRRWHGGRAWLGVLRSLALRAGDDQRRLQLAQERCIVRELARELAG